jgi:hypothetical protein
MTPHNDHDSVDSVISDLHAWRRELSDQFDGDVHEIVNDAMRRQETSGHPIVRRPELTNEANCPSGSSVSNNKSSDLPG